jgi:hypothetical protein
VSGPPASTTRSTCDLPVLADVVPQPPDLRDERHDLVRGGGYREGVTERPDRDAVTVTTAAELERMTPAERQEHFDASVVTDLSQVHPEFLARVRARLEQRIAAQDASQSA